MANFLTSGNGPTPGGVFVQYGISIPTVVKSARGILFRVSVTTAGTTAGSVYDFTSTTSPQNLVGIIPDAVGVYEFLWPCQTGIVIVPGTSQVVSVSFE